MRKLYLHLPLRWQKGRKRAFLLLEVLVAIMIVLLCIVPLFGAHVHLYQEEIKLLEQVHLERIATLTYIELVEELQQRPFTMNDLKQLSPIEIDLGNGKTLHFQRAYSLKGKNEYGLSKLDVALQFSKSKNKTYEYVFSCIVSHEKK